MADVTFEEKFEQPRSLAAPQARGITGWVVRTGLAKDGKGAERVMIGVALIAIVAAIAIFVMSNIGTVYEAPPIADGALPDMTGL